jgi:plastocyanin
MTSAQRVIGLRPARMAVAMAAVVGLLLAATWLSAGRARAANPDSVDIVNLAYNPAELTVQAGDTVTWTNNDGVGHTATSDAGAPAAFDSSTIAPSGTFQFTFDVVGTYAYHCNIHAFMHGTVVVEAAAASASATAIPSVPNSAAGSSGSVGLVVFFSLLVLAGLLVFSLATGRRRVRALGADRPRLEVRQGVDGIRAAQRQAGGQVPVGADEERI